MKKKNIIVYLIIVLVAIVMIVGVIKIIAGTANDNNDNTILDKQIYLNIIKNEEKNGVLSLNANEKIKYYYFNIVNYNEEEQKYNENDITPYIKINFNNDETNLIQWNLYSINNETDAEENWIEITEKGNVDTNFQEYYKGLDLHPYNKDDLSQNTQYYALKMTLNTEDEKFSTLEEDLTENFSIVLGYREIK